MSPYRLSWNGAIPESTPERQINIHNDFKNMWMREWQTTPLRYKIEDDEKEQMENQKPTQSLHL